MKSNRVIDLDGDGLVGAGLRSVWTVGLAIVAFQVVVVIGFTMVGLSLALRPTA
jgi:hypothetical protein